MVKAILVALFCLAPALGFASSETKTLKVAGMTCGSCEKSISDSVSKVPGVKSCKADHTTGVVSIVTDGVTQVSDAALTEAVTKAGFKVATAEAKPNAKKK